MNKVKVALKGISVKVISNLTVNQTMPLIHGTVITWKILGIIQTLIFRLIYVLKYTVIIGKDVRNVT